ncbi:unnamed protein product [Microthlaspi erraticum]|uniref:Uncharacterized protein n=1 Tax=Microthlaspi erraticum TaxID=1685480 RepID=A0A6D2IUN5_9BRAS|nr:unnamed protein product [Microthlaspi erraticum]
MAAAFLDTSPFPRNTQILPSSLHGDIRHQISIPSKIPATMMPPELQPRLFRPHISSSSSEPILSSPSYSPHMSPASSRNFIDRTPGCR